MDDIEFAIRAQLGIAEDNYERARRSSFVSYGDLRSYEAEVTQWRAALEGAAKTSRSHPGKP